MMSETIAADTVTTPAPAAAPRTTVSDLPPEALKERLERERSAAQAALLKDLGVASTDELKAAVEAARAAAESRKTEAEKQAALIAERDGLVKRVQSFGEALTAHANATLSALSDSQKAAVVSLAGDDPAAQLKAISALRPTWASEVPAPQGATVPAAAAPQTVTPTTPNRKQEYESLKAKNPFAASSYLAQHRKEIFPEA
jgi:hypothetical protein